MDSSKYNPPKGEKCNNIHEKYQFYAVLPKLKCGGAV